MFTKTFYPHSTLLDVSLIVLPPDDDTPSLLIAIVFFYFFHLAYPLNHSIPRTCYNSIDEIFLFFLLLSSSSIPSFLCCPIDHLHPECLYSVFGTYSRIVFVCGFKSRVRLFCIFYSLFLVPVFPLFAFVISFVGLGGVFLVFSFVFQTYPLVSYKDCSISSRCSPCGSFAPSYALSFCQVADRTAPLLFPSYLCYIPPLLPHHDSQVSYQPLSLVQSFGSSLILVGSGGQAHVRAFTFVMSAKMSPRGEVTLC